MSLGSRIKERREQLHMSRIELADKIGVTPSAISNYENGISSPKIELMYSLFDVLDCDANYLHQDEMKNLKYKDKATPEEFENIIKKYRLLDDIGRKRIDFDLEMEVARSTTAAELEKRPATIIDFREDNSSGRMIEYFYSVSAGSGQVIFDDVYSEQITIPDLPKYHRVAYAVKVSGHSMEPLYHDGDCLLIEPTCEIEIGEIGIFNVDGQGFVKKLGETELISLNAGYKNIAITENAHCMGRVVDKYPMD